MININTILSAFQDKLTLLQWLKKVEEALNNATLSNVSVQQQTESTFKLKFEFEDGTSIESTDITIPQGETGNGISSIAKTSTSGYVDTYTITYTDGSTFNFTVTNGRDGEGIAATVEVGQTTTGEAGTQAMVENVGTPTNAVLKFTIPKGDKGDKGDPAEITAETLLDYLIGSTDITVDLDETGAKVVFKLDQTVIDKLDSIVPNNGEPTTETLQTLKVGNTNYEVPQLYRYRIDINALSSAELSTLIDDGITYIEFVSNRNDITSFSTLSTPDKFLSIVRLSGANTYIGTLETYKNFIIGDTLYIKAEFLNTDGTITTNEFKSAEDITWDGGAEITPL